MNFALAYNYSIATVLIVIYLALPTTILAHATMEAGFPAAQAVSMVASPAPCGDCPCSDGQGSDCCDSSFCNCSCHAPLSQGVRLVYAPLIASQNFLEPSWSFPMVYRPIFVPPQNQA